MSEGDNHDDQDEDGRHEARFDELEGKRLFAAWCGEFELDEYGDEDCHED